MDVLAARELLPEDEGGEREAGEEHQRARPTEDVDRLRLEAPHEPDGEEIEEHLERARDAVLRDAGVAGAVVHFHLADARAGAVGEDGDEAMHLAVEAELVGDLAPVNLQRAPEIADRGLRHPADHRVCDLRGNLAEHDAVFAVLPPAGDEVEAFVELRDHRGDVARVVLHVGVHRDDDRRRDVAEPRVESSGLPAVAPKEDALEVRAIGGEPLEQLLGAVAARVVDRDDLVRLAPLLHHLVDLVEERLDVLDLVVDRENDAYFRGRHGGFVERRKQRRVEEA